MSEEQGALVVDFGKVLDISNCKFFYENLPVVTGKESSLSLDLSLVEKIDSTGVQLVYAIYKTAIDHEIEVNWSDISSQVKDAIEILGMNKILFENKEG